MLFGDNERYMAKGDTQMIATRKEYHGTLCNKHAPDFQIGDWGCTDDVFQVIGKVSDNECLAVPKHPGSQVMLIRGLDMSKVTDGVQFILPSPVVIETTYSYQAVNGGRKTVLVLEFSESKLWRQALDEVIAHDVAQQGQKSLELRGEQGTVQR